MNSIPGWLLAALCLFSAGPATAAEWESYPGFFGPGHAGIAIGDYDGDGTTEAVVTGHTVDWYYSGTQLLAVLSGNASGDVRVREVTVLHGVLMGSVIAAPKEGQEDRLVAVVSGDFPGRRILVLGDVPLRILRTVEVPLIGRAIAVTDVDGDGEADIVALTDVVGAGRPIVLDYQTGATKWTGKETVEDIGVAQLDGDAAGELILAGTQIGRASRRERVSSTPRGGREK